MNILPAHPDIESFFPQSAPATVATDGLAAVTAEHIFILYFVFVLVHPFEKLVDADDGVFLVCGRTTFPNLGFLDLGEVAIGFKNRYSVLFGVSDEQFVEIFHLFASPAGNGLVIDASAFVGYDQVFAYAYDFAQASANRTGSQRTVETEKVFIRLAKCYSVHFEAVAELFLTVVSCPTFLLPADNDPSVPLVKSSLDGPQKPG